MNAPLSPLLVAFPLTLTLSFLVGLALREYYIEQDHLDYFGSVVVPRSVTVLAVLTAATAGALLVPA